jgi:ATP-dependent helicase HrpB
MSPRDLPIYELESAVVTTLRASGRVIVQAPTGSGKSTQIPQMLLRHGLLGERGEIVVLQPRRLAARMLAKRVAEEVGTPLGGIVGYQIRLESKVSEQTSCGASAPSFSTSFTSATSTGTSRSPGQCRFSRRRART